MSTVLLRPARTVETELDRYNMGSRAAAAHSSGYSKLPLLFHHAFLDIPRRKVVVKVQAAFPHRHDSGLAHPGLGRQPSRYLTGVPEGTSAPGCTSTGLPSTEAARTMPWDSTPISFTGSRLVTITTCLPMSSSAW